MTLRGYTAKQPINILSEDEVNRIHSGTLEVLERTGVVFEHKQALEILEGAGCKVDHKKQRVRFPPGLVEECLSKCPSSFILKARESKNDLRLGGHTVYFGPFVGMNKGDPETGARLRPTTQEAAETARLLDALDKIHMTVGLTYLDIEGVEPLMQVPTSLAILIKNSSKVGIGMSSYDFDIWATKMAQATNQELLGAITHSPPLTWAEDIIESAFRYFEVGFPIMTMSGHSFAASSPATIAGSLALENAEMMSMMVLQQVVKPGSRFIASTYAQPLDMRTGMPLLGAIEKGISIMAFAQMWRHYGIPRLTGSSSDSKVADYQCGYEKSMLRLQALSGANVVLGAGGLYDELTFSPIVLVIDNDILGMIGRVLDGIEVTEETLALDLINEVGPIPGHYLNTAHTRKWWKHELSVPDLADRQSHPEWVQAGSKNIIQRAKERMAEILATHEPTPLPEDQEKAIDEILEEARSHYKQQGLM